MRTPLTAASLLAAAAILLASITLTACNKAEAPGVPVAALPNATTTGSAKGDFGAPQGEPIKAVLT